MKNQENACLILHTVKKVLRVQCIEYLSKFQGWQKRKEEISCRIEEIRVRKTKANELTAREQGYWAGVQV